MQIYKSQHQSRLHRQTPSLLKMNSVGFPWTTGEQTTCALFLSSLDIKEAFMPALCWKSMSPPFVNFIKCNKAKNLPGTTRTSLAGNWVICSLIHTFCFKHRGIHIQNRACRNAFIIHLYSIFAMQSKQQRPFAKRPKNKQGTTRLEKKPERVIKHFAICSISSRAKQIPVWSPPDPSSLYVEGARLHPLPLIYS